VHVCVFVCVCEMSVAAWGVRGVQSPATKPPPLYSGAGWMRDGFVLVFGGREGYTYNFHNAVFRWVWRWSGGGCGGGSEEEDVVGGEGWGLEWMCSCLRVVEAV